MARSGAVTCYNGSLLAVGNWALSDAEAIHATIRSCDYTANTVLLNESLPANCEITGLTAAIDAGAYGGSFVVRGVREGNILDFGDQDPIAGRATITKTEPEEKRLATSSRIPIARVGMHVVNEAMEPIGQVASLVGGIVLDRPFQDKQFVDHNGDGIIHAYLMEFGKEDRVEVPGSVWYSR